MTLRVEYALNPRDFVEISALDRQFTRLLYNRCLPSSGTVFGFDFLTGGFVWGCTCRVQQTTCTSPESILVSPITYT